MMRIVDSNYISLESNANFVHFGWMEVTMSAFLTVTL
jgi:hypothetical protein